MSRSKKLYILLGILAAVCVITFSVTKYEEHKENIKNSDEIILELNSDEVNAVSWEYESEKLAFHKKGNWIYDGDGAFPVDEEKIDELLEQFQEFGVSFIIKDVEDFGQYGLDDPVCTINVETADEDYEILLGDYSTMDSQRYVSIGDGNVYLIKNDLLEYFDAALSDMIDHDEIPDYDKVTSIQFTGSEDYQVVYEENSSKSYCEDDVYFAKRDENYLPLDTSRVNSYLETLSYIGLTDYVTYNVSDENLKAYGLDEPELVVTVNYTSENNDYDEKEDEEVNGTFVLSIGRDPKEKKAEKDMLEDEEVTAYARIGESKIIYKITSDDYKEIIDMSYDSLRHQEVLSADFGNIFKIDITLEGVDYTITSKEKKGDRIYYYQKEKVDIDNFKSALETLQADSFTDESPEKKEEISLTFYLDNENFQEVSVKLYRYNGEDCLAVVDGKTVSFVERTNVVDLIEAVNAIVLN